ncbi:MAG: hypothetical protein U0326_09560 [Polyangiales bacterium]
MIARPRRFLLSPNLCALPRAVVAGLLTALLVFFAALGGTRYFFCVPMERAQLTCCCPKSPVHEVGPVGRDARAVAEISATCCEGRRVSPLPPTIGAPLADVGVPAPVLVAFLPLLLHLVEPEAPDGTITFTREGRARAGPEPPVYARCCSYLI